MNSNIFSDIGPMEFHNLSSFRIAHEKKGVFSSLYLLILPSSYERETIANFLFEEAQKKRRFFRCKISADSIAMEQLKEAIQNQSLFQEEPFIVFDSIEMLSKKEKTMLFSLLPNPGCLVLGAKERRDPSFISEIEKRGIVVDATFEKPKEKEERLIDWIIHYCKASKKKISTPGTLFLIEASEGDYASIRSELDKLITYVGDQENIELKHIQTIGSFSYQKNVWEIAYHLVWGEKKSVLSKYWFSDQTFIHSLIAAIRYQLQQGYRLAILLERKKENLSDFFYPKWIEENREKARQLQSTFFREALQLLFEIDLFSKSTSDRFYSLFCYFQMKLLDQKRSIL